MNTAAIFLFFTQDTLDLFYRTVSSHENIPYGIQNSGHCSFNNQGKITQKV